MARDSKLRRWDDVTTMMPMDIFGFHPALLPGPPKEQITIRLDADILECYRAGGRRWQTRLNYDLSQIVAARRAAEAKPWRRASK